MVPVDREDTEHCKWSQCVSYAWTHRLTWNMTCLADHVTSRNLDLRSNLDIELLRLTCIYFDASRRKEHDGLQIMSLVFLVQKLIAKKTFLPKVTILIFLDLYRLTPWIPVDSDGISSKKQ